MAEILEFPFDSGAYEAADRKWLPGAMLRVATNARLDRDGRLVHRPGVTALSSGTMSANTMVPFDLANYQGRLVALGSQLTAASDRIKDLFEWVPRASKWRATSGEDTNSSTGPRVPQLSSLREVGSIPDLSASVSTVKLACGGGYVCAVINRDDGTAACTIHVFDPTTNQTLLLVESAMRLADVAYAGSDFWIVGVDSDEDIVRVNFDPSADEALSSVTTLRSNADVIVDLSVSTFGTGTAVAYASATEAVVRTYDSAGAAVDSWVGNAADTRAVALVGNAAGTRITLCYQDASSEYFASTWDETGSLQAGPTSLFSGAGGSGVRLGAGMGANGTTIHIVGVNELNEQGLYQGLIQSSHGATGADTYYDARPAMGPVGGSDSEYTGWFDLRATNNTLGTFHITGERRMPQCFLAQQLCDTQSTGTNYVSKGAYASGKLYIPVVHLAENTGLSGDRFRCTIVEATDSATARRQMAEVAGELLIAGGLPLTYDGRTMTEIGFAECPIVSFDTEGTTSPTGNLDLLGVYQVKACWACYNGKTLVCRSQPSPPASHTLTSANDRITWKVTTPHSLRRHRAFRDQGLTVVVELYRTINGGANFQLDARHVIDPTDSEAEPVLVSSTQSDSLLDDNAVIYSDESGLEISAPFPFDFVASARDRAFAGGTPDAQTWLMSDLNIPGRQVAFPFAKAAYTQRANQAITAVAAFEQVGLVWSQDEIQQVPGRGPERNGTGEFDSMVSVPSPGGCIDWRSVIVAPPGAFFQMAADKLMLLARSQTGSSAGEVSWVGQPVRETLASFPVITSAVHIRSQMAVAFSCNNTGGTDGRVLIYDLRRQQWFVDSYGLGAISALAELDGRLCLLAGGTVYQVDAAPGSGSFVSVTLETGLVRITPALGWGHVYKVGFLGEALGACSLQALIDYDNGQGFQSLGTESIAGTEGTLERFWSLPRHKMSRFALRFVVTGSSGSAGLRMNGWAASVDGAKNMVRVGSTGQVA
jgi:hypothetical protein